VGKPYECAVGRLFREAVPAERLEVIVPEEVGLHVDGERVHGTPMVSGEYQVIVRVCRDDGIWEEGHVALTVNPDPASLWKKLQSNPNGIFAKPDADKAALVTPQLTLLAASLRGRSHAHTGAYREDDFAMEYLPETGWHVMVVSDGAGSAKYSRRGSEIACHTAVEVLAKSLRDAWMLNEALEHVGDGPMTVELETLRRLSFNVLSPAVYEAQREIRNQALRMQSQMRDFNATIVIVIARPVRGVWFFASFAVGDGGAAVMEEDGHVLALMKPDGGEYAGQTLFLTTPQIFADSEKLAKRVQVGFAAHLKFFAVMTDGVSDPIFPNEASLTTPEGWEDLRQRLKQVMNLRAPAAGMEEALLEWLNFPSPGNHDDRTIILALPNGGAAA